MIAFLRKNTQICHRPNECKFSAQIFRAPLYWAQILSKKFLETKILKINNNFKIESLQCPKNSEVKVVTPVIARAYNTTLAGGKA